tara:strand:+ start:5785 stop:6711 length:927 start_codon:yes stop_codon:yes gene_type:complete
MAVPSSGELKLWDTLWNQELGGSQGENSLHSASVYAGFSTPDALSDFYGWSDVEVPAVTTNAFSSIGSTSMTANGNVTDTGNENPDRGFYFGTSNTYTSNTKYSVGTGGAGAFARGMSGLSYGTNYKGRAYACNSAGEVVGGQVNSTTNYPNHTPTFTKACLLSTSPSFNGQTVYLTSYWKNPYSGANNVASSSGPNTHFSCLCNSGAAPAANISTNSPNRIQSQHIGGGSNFNVGVSGCTRSGANWRNPLSGGSNGQYVQTRCLGSNICVFNIANGNQGTVPASNYYAYFDNCWVSDVRLKTNISYL